jgi:PKD repeat protein
MLNLKVVVGICSMLFLSVSIHAANTSECEVDAKFKNYACNGTLRVSNLNELLTYKSTLGLKKNQIKNLIIDFDVDTNSLSIATPCSIKVEDRRKMTTTGNLCLHGDRGVDFDRDVKVTANNIRLESVDKVSVQENNNWTANDVSLVNLGNTYLSYIRLGQNFETTANSFLIDSYGRSSIGRLSNFNIKESFGLFVRSGEDTVIGSDTKISASKIEIQTTDDLKLGNNVYLTSTGEVILNGSKCQISNKTTIKGSDYLGSCFLQSSPKGLFTINQSSGSIPLTINFDASKITDAKSFLISFGDSETLTTTSTKFSHVYNKVGIFTGLLKYAISKDKKGNWVYNKNAGSVQIIAKAQVNLAPVAKINCTTNNLLVTCNGLSSYDPEGMPLSFHFEYADGYREDNSTGLSSHAYAQAGLSSVKLTVYDQLGASSSETISVMPLLPPNVLPTVAFSCNSTQPFKIECDHSASKDSDGTISSFNYSFDDGATLSLASTNLISHTFSTAGSHTVTLKVTDNDGGESTLTQTISVKDDTPPSVDLACTSTKPYQVDCTVTASDVDANDSISKYNFDLGNETSFDSTTNTLHYNYGIAGSFIIKASAFDSYGVSSTKSLIVNVIDNQLPLANFNCVSNKVQTLTCSSSASDTDGTIASTSFITDDNQNFTGTSFTYQFKNGNDHSVTMITTDDLGGVSTKTQTFQVLKNQLPTFDISASALTGSAPFTATFKAINMSDSDGEIISGEWFVNNVSTSEEDSFTYTFNDPGTYSVQAEFMDDLGGITTKAVSVVVTEAPKIPPKAYFKYYLDGTYIKLRLGVLKTQYDIKSAYYLIDETTKIDITDFYPNTMRTYDLLTIGSHSITIYVEDVKGLTNTFTHTFEANADSNNNPPYANFSWSASNTREIFFDLTKSFSASEGQDITSYHLDFGDGESQDLGSEFDYNFAKHTYKTAGKYEVTLTVTLNNLTSTKTKSVVVTDDAIEAINPVASFMYYIFDFAGNVTFYDNQSGTPNGEIISYFWEFGDGTTGTGKDTTHFYDPGEYFVKLTVTDSMGKTNSQTQHITVLEAGANLISVLFCDNPNGPNLHCSAVTLDKDNMINRIVMNWGDGVKETPIASKEEWGLYYKDHTYSASGTYKVRVTAYTTDGRSSYQLKNIDMTVPKLVADLDCSLKDKTINCFNISTVENATQSSGVIDFGDGTTLSQTTNGAYTHTYSDYGTYTIKYTITNNYNQTNTATKSIDVNYIPITVSLNCYTNNLLVQCNGLGSYSLNSSDLTFTFDYGDSFVETNSTGLSQHAYSTAELHTVKLTVTNTNQESGSMSVSVLTVKPPNVSPTLGLICTNGAPKSISCTFSASDSDGMVISYDIDFGDSTSMTYAEAQTVNHIYETSGMKKIIVTATDNDGGVTTRELDFMAQDNHLPIPWFTCTSTKPQKIDCTSYSQANDIGDQIISYQWEYGDGARETSLIPTTSHLFTTSGEVTVKLKVTDQYGGESSIEQKVNALENKAPVINLTCSVNSGTTYVCSGNAYDLDGSVVSKSFTVDGVYAGSSDSIMYEFTNGGDHTVTLSATDELGKTGSLTKIITIDAPIVNFDCIEKSPLLIKCKISDDVNTENIKLAQFIFDDDESFNAKEQDYEFSTFGVHKVKLILVREDGAYSFFEKKLDLKPQFLMPLSKFSHIQNKNNISIFNGKKSLYQDRIVVKYLWNFGDGTQEESSNYSTSHQYSSYQEYVVSLTVVDSSGNKNTSTQTITTYDAEVSDPDLTNDDSLLGIDSDNDGIRDDIQLWINFETQNELSSKKILKSIARNLQLMIADPKNEELTVSLKTENQKLRNCLYGLISNDEKSRKLEKYLNYFTFRTEERYKTLIEINTSSVTALLTSVPSSDEDRMNFCIGRL